MKTYKLLALLFFIVFFSSCGDETEKKTNDQPKKVSKKSLSQEKVNKQEEYEIKFTDFSNQEKEFVEIFLSINDKKHRVDDLNGMGINTIEKSNFENFDIPKDAIGAIESYWAGIQTVFYIEDLDEDVSVKRGIIYTEDYDATFEYTQVLRVRKQQLQNKKSKNTSNSIADFYILNVMAVKDKNKAIIEVDKLINEGYSANYLWIPDYNSLSKAEYFSVYIGPYQNQKDCEIAVSEYRKIDPKAYGLLVSQENKRVQINGLNKISIKEPYH
ncbi:hypothetical protein N8Z79_06620 [Crocinitomicaceae bacterium]|nr:hypothetical protein [Crocinitomicaceae bacterium]